MTERRWLDPTEMAAWRALIETSVLLFDQLAAELKADAGLTFDDYEVLVHLSEAPERRLRMSDLAERVLQSRSRLTNRVDRLTDRGLVERRPCPDDGRVIYAVLTDRGWDVLTAAAPGHLDAVRTHLFDHLDPADVAALAEILPKINRPLRG